ncbi:hypothetical protein [Haloplanus aerogenes]|uniref:Uncharacterized protein n=1 Tax=Haloplanus aerogenes TaxID=660522 RepID=A0A3M0D8J8_9EURY|nr:hypothetical protein [Haloplanus aerogenes]AZH26452.1 hypothetical protein DU502_14215 [Haloplanus aerogenes]RMB18082.1 hypothetical protein ATH50_1529 [Haloplanus aerogenes]
MPDTKEGRERQAQRAEQRQHEWDIREARERGDEPEPPAEDIPPTCHRRGCNEPAAFRVLERYQEETGHGAVEAVANLCETHTAEEAPTRLEHAYEDYVFRVDPIQLPDSE